MLLPFNTCTHGFWNAFLQHDLRLMSFDRRVIQFVMNSPVFEKPWQTRRFLGRLIGRGIFSMEGDVHDAQRRIIAPAFTDAAVKRMTPILFMKAKELSERWKDIISQQATGPQNAYVTPKEPAAVVDVAHWFSRASFDVIGLCGFNYDFQALQEKPTEIYGAYRRLFDIADKGLGLRQLLGLYSSTLHILLVRVSVTLSFVSYTLRSGWSRRLDVEAFTVNYCSSWESYCKREKSGIWSFTRERNGWQGPAVFTEYVSVFTLLLCHNKNNLLCSRVQCVAIDWPLDRQRASWPSLDFPSCWLRHHIGRLVLVFIPPGS